MPSLQLGPSTIEHRITTAAPSSEDRAPLVFLHEGLGCVELWRSFPDDVRTAAGEPATLVYSRAGYGHSTPLQPPWPTTYMHREALEVLPALLERLDLRRPVLVGHSDGASIALLHAGAGHAVAGLVVMAPHVVVEARSISGIEAAREAYLTGGLRSKLARYHDDVDSTFWGWNQVWLSPDFRRWDITDALPGIAAPVLAIQGDDDEYGTLGQLGAIAAGTAGPVEQLIVPGGRHTLYSGDTTALVAAIATFIRAVR